LVVALFGVLMIFLGFLGVFGRKGVQIDAESGTVVVYDGYPGNWSTKSYEMVDFKAVEIGHVTDSMSVPGTPFDFHPSSKDRKIVSEAYPVFLVGRGRVLEIAHCKSLLAAQILASDIAERYDFKVFDRSARVTS
jgi:hypothetical protein